MGISFTEISSALNELIKADRSLDFSPLPDTLKPLFGVLTINGEKVAFATLEDDLEMSYKSSLSIFRGIYAEHSGEWASYDLSLVLCTTKDVMGIDTFANSIEVDGYFCRKYVIDSRVDLLEQLRRLPFVPLSQEIIGTKTLVDAQTFLKSRGVHSSLAKHLVIPGEGPAKISSDCLQGKYGEPLLKQGIGEYFINRESRTANVVRLKDVIIQNFRAYRGEHKFDLNADLIVLFGPNGFGKTSLFDAIDYVCTGGVARFEERFGNDTEKLLKTLTHLDCTPQECMVSATIQDGDIETIIERDMSNRSRPKIDGANKTKQEALMRFVGLSERLVDLTPRNFVNLFRATHIFGQEYQSLTSQFKKESMMPADTISRMLMLQDYVEATSKAEKVLDELAKVIRDSNTGMTILTERMRVQETEAQQLASLVVVSENPEEILTTAINLASKVSNKLGRVLELPTTAPSDDIRNWRALVTSRVESLSDSLEVSRKLQLILPDLSINRKKLGEKKSDLVNSTNKLHQVEAEQSTLNTEIESAETKVERLKIETSELETQKDDLKWLLEHLDEYHNLVSNVTVAKNELSTLENEYLSLASAMNGDQLKMEVNNSAKAVDTEFINTLREELSRIKELRNSIADWIQKVTQQTEVSKLINTLTQNLTESEVALRRNRDELLSTQQIENATRRVLQTLQESRSRLELLLDEIHEHLISDTCPVCGAKYESREQLIKREELQRKNQPEDIKAALQAWNIAKENLTAAETRMANEQIRVKAIEDQLSLKKADYATLSKVIQNYIDKAISLRIPTDTLKAGPAIDAREKEFEISIELKKSELMRLQVEIDQLTSSSMALTEGKKKLDLRIAEVRLRAQELQQRINTLVNESLKRKVSLESKDVEVEKDLNIVTDTVANKHGQLITAMQEVTSRKASLLNLQSEGEQLIKKTLELYQEISGLEQNIDGTDLLIQKLQLQSEPSLEETQILTEKLKAEVTEMEALQVQLLDVERALDASATSATLARTQVEIKKTTRAIDNEKEEMKKLEVWQNYLNNLINEMNELRRLALKEYTERYGPLASTLQKRLRPVYGFGDLKLEPSGESISVKVDRQGSTYLPSNYFSESQVQIVTMGLFISAAVTQTWSSFAPILLDDPVQHFDDLNSYSFVDLVKGLLTEPGKQRQFIISTCDDQLYRLLRQKFSNGYTSVIFYEFKAIGENGPNFIKKPHLINNQNSSG
jgi:DNA repair protein SbcC/Rad50